MKTTNINLYLKTINEVLDNVQKTSFQIDPYYKIFRSTLDNNEKVEFQDYSDTQKIFKEGIQSYQYGLTKLEKINALIIVIGIHKKLIADYRKYVAECEAMDKSTNYVEKTVDKDAFDHSEIHQEEAIDKVNKDQKIIRGLHLR